MAKNSNPWSPDTPTGWAFDWLTQQGFNPQGANDPRVAYVASLLTAQPAYANSIQANGKSNLTGQQIAAIGQALDKIAAQPQYASWRKTLATQQAYQASVNSISAPLGPPTTPGASSAVNTVPATSGASTRSPAPTEPSSSQNFDFSQLEQLWIQAGGPSDVAPVMAALAIQQSPGSTPGTASSGGLDQTSKENSQGLWQIDIDANANPEFAGEDLTNPQVNAKAAVALYRSSGLQPWSMVPVSDSDPYGPAKENPIVAAWNSAGGATGGTKAAVAMQTMSQAGPSYSTATSTASSTAPSTATPPAAPSQTGGTTNGITGATSTVPIPQSTFAAPIKGANIKDFHGFDLSGIPENELGNAEQAITGYLAGKKITITDPSTGKPEQVTMAQAVQQRIYEDFGYSADWLLKIPSVNAIAIWAALSLDPSSAAGQQMFQGAISDTKWWKTFDQNQRAFEEIQSTDPATAANLFEQAQDHVLATANQLGFHLSPAQMYNIAEMYASQSATPTGVLGSESGTSQEWLDQAVVHAVTATYKTGTPTNFVGAGPKATPTSMFGQQGATSDLAQQTAGGTNPKGLFGISAQLYQSFLGIAQNYGLYSQDGTGPINDQTILKAVVSAIQNWTGSNSFGSSNLINGAVQQYTTEITQLAEQEYPAYARAIQLGQFPKVVSQIQSTIAQTLNVNEGAIDLASPQYAWIMKAKTPLTIDQINRQLVTNPSYGYLQSDAGKAFYQQLRADFINTAQNYMMFSPTGNGPLSPQAIDRYVLQAIGQFTPGDTSGASSWFQNMMMAQAERLYPALAPSIRMNTVGSVVSSLQQAIGQMLNRPPGSINLTSPQYDWIVKSPVLPTMDQIEAKVASTPAYLQSDTGLGYQAQLYQSFLQSAQNYGMYSPDEKGLLTSADIHKQVDKALQQFAGSPDEITAAEGNFQNEMLAQAQRMYPQMAQSFANNQDFQQITAPYASAIGQTLDLNPNTINFASPKWNWVIATPDAKTGQKGMLTLDQVQKKITSDPAFGYDQTSTAKQSTMDTIEALNKAFGFGGA